MLDEIEFDVKAQVPQQKEQSVFADLLDVMSEKYSEGRFGHSYSESGSVDYISNNEGLAILNRVPGGLEEKVSVLLETVNAQATMIRSLRASRDSIHNETYKLREVMYRMLHELDMQSRSKE